MCYDVVGFLPSTVCFIVGIASNLRKLYPAWIAGQAEELFAENLEIHQAEAADFVATYARSWWGLVGKG